MRLTFAGSAPTTSLLLLAVVGCDPITRVEGRVVRAPEQPVANATVTLRCEGLKPDEGIQTKTDASGAFTLATVGGAFPDTCVLQVKNGGPHATTIGASKTDGDDPASRVRRVRVTLPGD